jgi:hypothetical protein
LADMVFPPKAFDRVARRHAPARDAQPIHYFAALSTALRA